MYPFLFLIKYALKTAKRSHCKVNDTGTIEPYGSA